MLKEYLLKKALDEAYARIKSLAAKHRATVSSSATDSQAAIESHVASVDVWSDEVSFSDLKGSKRTQSIFVDLDLYVQPRRLRVSESERVPTIRLTSLLSRKAHHLVLLGQPGAGKTTSMKQLCQLLIHDASLNCDLTFPLLVRLRDVSASLQAEPSSVVLDEIAHVLGLRVEWQQGEGRDNAARIKRDALTPLLDSFGVLLILDGFDELASQNHREIAMGEIRRLCLDLKRSMVILTSRTGDFLFHVENADTYELSPLSRDQISDFAKRWLGNQEKAVDFTERVYKSPFADTAIRPLTLAHLCAIFERVGQIPDRPKTVYRKVVNLLLEEWDQQRSVKRQSRYARFEVDRKLEFLSQVAFTITAVLNTSVFSKEQLKEVYDRIYVDYDLVAQEGTQVVAELETHTGLLIQSGYEKFEFAHKSLQEYLSAEYLVRLPSIPGDTHTLSKLANELAVAVSISSSPSLYLSHLLLRKHHKSVWTPAFLKAFASRLLLERADFNKSISLGMALLSLYSLYIQANALIDKAATKITADPVVDELGQLVRNHLDTDTVIFLREYYRVSRGLRVGDGSDVLQMTKSKDLTHQTHPLRSLYLPHTVFAPGSLIR